MLAGQTAACARRHDVRHGNRALPTHHVPQFLRLIHQLIERHIDQGIDLVFDHRTHARQRRTRCKPNEASLRDGRVEDALRPERVENPLGEPTNTQADVLSQDDDAGVAGHLFVQRFVEGVEIAQFPHLTLAPGDQDR